MNDFSIIRMLVDGWRKMGVSDQRVVSLIYLPLKRRNAEGNSVQSRCVSIKMFRSEPETAAKPEIENKSLTIFSSPSPQNLDNKKITSI